MVWITKYWAEFYASHGFIAMTIGNFDRSTRDFDSEWDYADRALGLLDATQTIKEENLRELSPLFGQVDTSSFAVSGYSTSGGGIILLLRWTALLRLPYY